MNWFRKAIEKLSAVGRYRIRRIILISLAWTLIDLFLYFRNVSNGDDIDYPYHEYRFTALLLRSSIILLTSFLMSWLLLRLVKIMVGNRSLLINWLIKVFLLLLVAIAASIGIFFLHFLIIKGVSLGETINQFINYFQYTNLLTDTLLFWLVMLLSAQIIV